MTVRKTTVGCLVGMLGLALAAARSSAQTPVVPQPPPGASAVRAGAQGAPETPAITTDVVVVQRDGRLADHLEPADFTVTVDGQPRRLLWVRRVGRGPGAAGEAASRQARAGGTVTFAAEPSRIVIVAVDQASIVRGEERVAVRAATALLDRLGIEDRVAVVRVPMPADALVTLTTDRPEAREALAQVTGQAVTADPQAAEEEAERRAAADPVTERVADPERVTDPVRQAVTPVAETPARPVGAEPATPRQTLAALMGVLKPLQSIPGRKTVVLISAGFSGVSTSQAREAAAAAAAARVVIFGLGLRSTWDDPRTAPDTGPLEALAVATGGAFQMLGRNPESNVERLVPQLAACYVLGIAASATDADGRRRTLRVSTSKRDLTVRAPLSFGPSAEVDDYVPPAPEAGGAAGVLGPEEPSAARPALSPEREIELQTALARLTDYVAGYERHYSGLVAEEEYRQTILRENVRLRSDFLLVKPEENDRWVSFRDVFEVNGRPVRDREDRLKKLFLDPTPESVARLQAIKDESARYNIGPITRNINVPLFPLAFLSPSNRGRFTFKLSRYGETAGVDAWKVEYTERVRPTIITDLNGNDVPVSGWFIVDMDTGAIVESLLRLMERAYTALITVTYRRDRALGMWVPVRMRESYAFTGLIKAPAPPAYWGATSLEGQADYTKFRRFQVKTDVTITIPK